MAQTNELPLLHSEPELLNKLGALHTTQQSNTYTVTFSINFGFMAGLADTAVGSVVLRIVSVVIAAGGFVISLAVIVLAPMFPSLVSAAPPQASTVSSPLGQPLATSSPHIRALRRRHIPSLISVSVRRDPNIVPIIERRDSASPSPAPPSRRVSFSPQSSSASVPTLADFNPPSQPGSSNGHAAIRRVQEHERESGPAYILPTPPASITSVSSEADDTETAGVDEFGANCSPAVGKRGRRTFTFSKKDKGKGKAAPTGDSDDSRTGSGSRPRAQSLGFVIVESNADAALPKKNRHSLFASTPGYDEVLRESEGETTSTHDDRASRTSGGEKEARRRSGLSFQDFKAAFGKRERRSSAIVSPSAGSGSYTLSSPSDRAEALPSDGVPRTGAGIGIGRPSTAPSRSTPRSASDELAQARRANSPSLRLDTTPVPLQSEQKGSQSPVAAPSGQPPVQPAPQSRAPLFNGEVVIRNESGRRRTRTTAIPGLYTDGEVVRRW